MPELPEVHTTAKMLNNLLSGRKILDVWTSYGGVIHEGKNHIKNRKYFSEFKKKVVGEKVKSVSRRGKNVLIHLSDNKTILVHMKMTGHLLFGSYRKVSGNSKSETLNSKQAQNSKSKITNSWEKEKWMPNEPTKSPLWDPFNRFVRLVFTLSGKKHLVLSDVRKFAKVCLIEKDEKTDIDTLGPEPLEKSFGFSSFKFQLMKKPAWKIKTVLMNQELIAGVGNIYSDEVLWLADIHPESQVSKIPEKKMKILFQELKIILKKGIEFSGDSTSDYRRPDGQRGSFQHHHKVYRRKGEGCLKKNCAGTISRIVVTGRSAHFCPKHQKKY